MHSYIYKKRKRRYRRRKQRKRVKRRATKLPMEDIVRFVCWYMDGEKQEIKGDADERGKGLEEGWGIEGIELRGRRIEAGA